MSVRATCPKCGKTVKGGDDWAGKSGKCPGCGGPIRFGADSSASGPSVTSSPIPPQMSSVADAPPPIIAKPPNMRSDGGRSRIGGRPLWAYWRYAAVAVSCLLVGYFAGREHIKYQIRAALSTFGQQVSESLNPLAASGSAGDGFAVVAGEQSPPFEIESIDSRITESNDTWERHSWLLTLRNDSSQAIQIHATIEWLDAGGFVVDDDTEYGLIVPANQSKTFRGYALIRSEVSQNVASVNARVGLD